MGLSSGILMDAIATYYANYDVANKFTSLVKRYLQQWPRDNMHKDFICDNIIVGDFPDYAQ